MNEDTITIDEAQEAADFGAGFEGKTAEKVQAKEKPAPATTAREEADDKPEFIQVTAKDWAEVQAAARRTASYDQQFSKLFGTTGNIQKLLNEQKAAAPRDLEVKMPDNAFTKMAKDFPELAELSREEFQAALVGLKAAGNAKPDAETIKNTLVELEIEDLEDAYPEWRAIVGAINVETEQPDPNNPFRKWLATKDKSYQDRINGTIRAPVIQRAIRLFQNETRAAAKPTTPLRDTARADRIAAAVKPRGDNAIAASGKSDDEEFEAGFKNGR